MYKIRKGEVVCLTLLLFLCALYFLRSVKPLSRERAIWLAECELGVISDPDCPIDGGWSSWSAWSACSGACDDVGHRFASRRCSNPPPAKDGLPCDGPQEKVEACQITNCTIKDYRDLVKKDPIKTEALHLLETFPALLERCLQMECPYEAIEAAVSTDNTWQINIESLWNALQCVKHNIGCRVIGEWSPWGAWSACGARCGPGLRWRIRLCNNPPPSDAGLICHGTPLQSIECEGDQCEVNKDGEVRDVWGEWKQWSSCSESCGMGVTRRRRTCNEKPNPLTATNWGTHCQGQHDQLKICDNEVCVLNGSWSGWGSWSPCSQTCGPGRRTRTRSCSRPSPSGGGAPCLGPRTATASCHLIPCEVYPHTVAVLNGESSLKYNFEQLSSLFHVYIRFLPLSPHGTLVRRGAVHNSRVKLNLHKWRICLHANDFGSCVLPHICTPLKIEPAVWHTVLATVTNEGATLRLDDSPRPIRGTFTCDPDFPNDKMSIVVGERLHGEIQEVVLNFMPLSTVVQRDIQKQTDYIPNSASNIAYEIAGLEEAYLPLDTDQYARIPCFDSDNEWRIEITLKPKRDSGTILFLKDDKTNSWLHMNLLNMRIKLKMVSGEMVSCSSSFMEYPIDEWVDVTLHKKRDSNTIEATINMGDHLHVIAEDETVRKRREMIDDDSDLPPSNNVSTKTSNDLYFEGFPQNSEKQTTVYSLCSDEYFVGGVPMEIKNNLPEDFTSFYGIVASLSINSVLQDLHKISIERCTNDRVQVSSRTASLSGLYRETAWGLSGQLNLSCLHARKLSPYQSAHWLFLDTEVYGKLNSKSVRSVDDGKVLKLVAAADNDLRGFYTCRAHANKRTINIVTYGVIGKIQNKITSPDAITAIAMFTTLTLVIITLTWLFIEGVDDLRNGFGFFRDRSISPQEEAEEVCKYIDQNSCYFKCKSDMRVAKARARCKARQLMSRMSFGAQEPEGLMEVCDQFSTSEDSSPELPALPEIRSCIMQTHEVYRCEPCYISSPRHGSITTPRAKCTSSSSANTCTPRALCSSLLPSKRQSSRNSLSRCKKSTRTNELSFKPRSDLITIKSSTYVNRSPAQKILQKFHQLRSEDI